jgi:glycosyltransferase involved in cell wall biosynthesis
MTSPVPATADPIDESRATASAADGAILMVCFTFPPEFGGAIVQALRLGAELQTRGCEVAFLADNGDGADADLRHESFDLYRRRTFTAARSNLRKLIWTLRIVLFALAHPKFRVFHFHSVQGPELLAMPVLKWLGRKTIVKLTLAESDDPATLTRRRLMGKLYRACLGSVHRYIAISPSLKRMACSVGVAPERVLLVANGVETARYSLPMPDEIARARAALDIPEGVPVMASIGAVEHRKGYDLLIAAFETIRRERPDAVLLIIGPGNEDTNPFHVQLQQYMAERGIGGVRFLGRREDIHEILRAVDLFAFCSRQEGFGTAIVEAMCAGLAVAVMDIPEITGWIVGERPDAVNTPSRDPQEFARLCLQLLAQRTPASSAALAESAARDFGMAAIGNTYEALYAELRGH